MRKRNGLFLAAVFLIFILAGFVQAEEGSVRQPKSLTQTETFEDTVSETVSYSGISEYAGASRYRSRSIVSFTDCYGNQLSGNAKKVYDSLVNAYVYQKITGEISISFSPALQFQTEGQAVGDSLKWDAAGNAEYGRNVAYVMQAAYDAFIYDYPEVFWMGTFTYYSTISFKGGDGLYTGSVTSVRVHPYEAYSGASGEQTAFAGAVNSACQAVSSRLSNTSRYEKVTAIHDYLCEKLWYDGRGGYAHSAAGAFLKGGAVVCEGYAKAFKILCNKFEIPCVLVVGDADGAHMWNYVRMEDRQWYLVDVTWDDNDSGADDTYLLAGSSTTGYGGLPLGQERTVYTNFSGSAYTESFAVPMLHYSAYKAASAAHTHVWTVESRKEPTCLLAGYETYVCQDGLCRQTYRSVLEARGHSFLGYTSNKDATVLADGTKTAVCENGCGEKHTVTDSGSRLRPKMKLNVSSVRLKKGQSTTAVKVTGLAKGDRVVSWKSAKTSVVKVSKSGKITAQKKTGTTKITVRLLSGLTKSITVKVQSGTVRTTKISGISSRLTLKRGAKKQLKPVVAPITSKEPVKYSSSNKKVAVVSSKGVITAKSAGKAKITVRSGSKKVTVTVTVPKPQVQKIKNIPSSVTLRLHRTKTLKPRLYPAGSQGKVTYRSSNKRIVTVSSKGKITAKKKGKAVITVTAGRVSVKCRVTVR